MSDHIQPVNGTRGGPNRELLFDHRIESDFSGVGGDIVDEHPHHDSHDEEPALKKGPENDPQNLAEQMVSGTLRGRESKCSASCGTGKCGSGSGCMTGGCGSATLVELILNEFDYADERRIVEI